MRQSSLIPSLHDVKASAAAMRHPLMLQTFGLESDFEGALQPRLRLMRLRTEAATPFMSSEILLMVQLRLKLHLILTLQPTSPPVVS